MEDIIFMVGMIYLLCALPKSILKQFLSSNGQVKKPDVQKLKHINFCKLYFFFKLGVGTTW